MRTASFSLHESQVEIIDEIADEFDIAKSEIVRSILSDYLDEDARGATLDAVSDAQLQLARKEQLDEEMRAEQRLIEQRANFADRVLGYYRKRLEGDAAYHPDDMAALSANYREDARIWHDDPDEIERKTALVDKWQSWYVAGYWAREHADQVATEVNPDDVDGWFSVGEDIHRLRDHVDEVRDRITGIADRQSCGFDADAVIDAVASEWSVSRGAAHLLIESMTVTGSSVQDALSLGGDRLTTSDAPALSEAEQAARAGELPGDATIRQPDANDEMQPVEIDAEEVESDD